jgi:TetR/AcrR family transcriptional regulator
MKHSDHDEGTASRIREAAKSLFLDKGYDGTTMQAIADDAKVNKALLHYYFQSKDRLFLLIFREELAELSASLSALWEEGDKTIQARLEDLIDGQTAFLARAPRLPLFIITEMTRNPELIEELLTEFLPPPQLFSVTGEETGKQAGQTEGPGLPVLAELVSTVYSLIFFPALAAPMIQHLLGVDSPLIAELTASHVRLAKELVARRLGATDPRPPTT